MIEITGWAGELARKLEEEFGPRLRFVGYQGSYGRGEATEDSDIDIVTVLDQVELDDLARYRRLVGTMPRGELACGFLCGQKELAGWPRADLVNVVLDTKPVLGSLEAMVPAFTQEDYRQALVLGVSALYHGACHGYLYSGAERVLPGLRKAAFFCLRLAYLCASGEYVPARRDLIPKLAPAQREMLETENVERAYTLLIAWSGQVLRGSLAC